MADAQTFDLLPILAEIFRVELGLPVEPPRVFIYNQRFQLPTDNGLFVSVARLGFVLFGSAVEYVDDPDTGALLEQQSVNVNDMIQVDVASRDESAERRQHELIMALKSFTAQQAMEIHAFSIAQLPSSMVDVSHVEAAARLNRYSMTVAVTCSRTRTRPVTYYDTFPDNIVHIEP